MGKFPEDDIKWSEEKVANQIALKKQENKTVMEKFGYIRSQANIYNIVFRNAGIAFMFFEGGPTDRDSAWRDHLKVYEYHDTFELAVDYEYTRLTGGEG